MRILFALSGLHQVDRGAEIAFINIASELQRQGEDVTLIGSGPYRSEAPYRYLRAPAIARERFERWPKFPLFRNEAIWEEATFAAGLLRLYRPTDYDVTVTCGYPFTNWALRRPAVAGKRPPHVYVTQNGDWPAIAGGAEYRFFGCEGLICTNPDYLARNADRYRCALISNGVDTTKFSPGEKQRQRFGLPMTGPVVLMVSALIGSKNVDEGIKAVAAIEGATLVVAGDGPLRRRIEALASRELPGRFIRLTVDPADMPALYRTADAFLHLSRDESFGNVFVEAMACGTPIVAYDLPRTRWILGNLGHLAADGIEALAAKLREALESNAAGERALVERAASFDWPKIAGQYRNFLGEVTGKREGTYAGPAEAVASCGKSKREAAAR